MPEQDTQWFAEHRLPAQSGPPADSVSPEEFRRRRAKVVDPPPPALPPSVVPAGATLWLPGEGGMGGPSFLRLDKVAKPDLTDSWYVEDLLRPGVLAMIAAPKGVGKSQIRLELGLLLAKGDGLFLGRYPVVSGPRTVLVVDEENGDAEEWRREEIHLARLGLQRDGLPYYRLSRSGLRLDRPEWQAWLTRKVEEHQPDVLFLDSISMLYACKEVREDLFPIHEYLRNLIRAHPGLTIVLVHHLKKKDAAQSTYERGLDELRGGGWDQWVEAVLILSQMPDRRVHLGTWKRIPYSTLILKQTDDGPLVYLSEVAASEEVADANRDDKVMAAVDAGATNEAQVRQITGLSHGAYFRAVKDLRNPDKDGRLAMGLPLRRAREPNLTILKEDESWTLPTCWR